MLNIQGFTRVEGARKVKPQQYLTQYWTLGVETLSWRCQGGYYRSSISKTGARRLGPHTMRSFYKRHAAMHGCSLPYGQSDIRPGQVKVRQFSLFCEKKANDVPHTHPTRRQSKGWRSRLATETVWLTHTHLVNVYMHTFCTTACILVFLKKKRESLDVGSSRPVQAGQGPDMGKIVLRNVIN